MKRRKRRMMAILLVFAMLFSMVDPGLFAGVITAQAEETTNVQKGWNTDKTVYYIGDSSNLEYVVNHYADTNSEGELLRKAKYEVTDNITLGDWAENGINIGTKDYPFANEFDGNGYTISGLVYNDQIATSGGLFSYLNGATIRNLIIDGAVIRSNQYGGVLAAQAINSTIQNVTITNSKCKIASLGTIVGLITTGGLYGGALVGYAGGTKFYNCESRNTEVYVDSTGGVQALGGDGMYMGGLVGWMDNGSIIEYSRVVGGEVSTEYYVAVGALAANNLYAGGIVGRIDGNYTDLDGNKYEESKILDCFSSAAVNYDGECYVSVGAGLSGYAGGIAARVSGENYEISRCHYAGNLSGHLLNSILVLPVIAMEDYYLGGIAGQVENSSKIQNCYFNWENAIVDNDYPGGPKVPAIWGQSNTGTVTTIGSAQYSNPDFFVSFDFNGTTMRETDNAAPFDGEHSNKWVIDPVNNMPVHGKRVEASMDFPGAGTITFAETSIQEAQTTDTNEKNISQIAQVHADMNEALTLTATVNEGYNFKGWYKNGTLVAGTEESPEYTLTLGGEDGLPYEDNEVYEAKYTANVIFKGMNDGVDVTKEYTYNQELNPEDATLSDENYVFLGWSETEYDKEDLQSSTIPDIQFVGNDTSYPVTRPMTLYPVFIKIENYNVKVQMESAALEEGSAYIKGKDGSEGTAEVGTDENGLFIAVNETANVSGSDEYRFDGWYEISKDNPEGTLVSRSKTFYLTNVDLNVEHRYEARYQYKVTTWIPMRTGSGPHFKYGDSESNFGEYYVKYGENVNTSDAIPQPSFNPGHLGTIGVKFSHWTNTGITQGTSYSKTEMNRFAEQTPTVEVKQPMDVYAIVQIDRSTNSLYYPVHVKSDFPAGTVEVKMNDGSLWSNVGANIKASLTIKDGYNFKGFWQYYFDDDKWTNPDENDPLNVEQGTYNEENKTWSCIWNSGYGYWAGETRLVARLTADVNFHKYGEETPVTVERKYDSLLFCTDANAVENWDDPNGSHVGTPNYEEPGNTVVGVGTTPTDESMYRNGYKFIGWTTDEGIFTDRENYVVSSEVAIKGSLLTENTRVTETMDVYPVYLKYDITLKTNFDGSDSAPEGVIVESTTLAEEGTVIFTFTGDGYEFATPEEWTVKANGTEIDVDIKQNEDGTYTITGLDTETKYETIASCTATVTFNNKDGSEVKKGQYDYNQELGSLPMPTQEVNSEASSIGVNGSFEEDVNAFVGWNTGEGSEYATEQDKVTGPMNLQPVYITPDLELNSDLKDSGATITVSKTGEVMLNAPEKDGYEFAGWEWTDGEESKTITVEPSNDGTYTYQLTPEEARKSGTYTAKYNPIVTYKIPKVENDTLAEGETVEGSVPYNSVMGEVIDSTIVEVTTKILKALKDTDYVFEGKWSTEAWDSEGTQTVFTGPVTEQITLYPVITEKTEEQVKIYSNIDDSNAVVELSRKDGKVTFPDAETLPEGIVKEGSNGINGEAVETEFVGYSLVTITQDESGKEISRVSDALYAPGDEIDADEITAYTGVEDEKHQIARIYAVWAQVQTIPEGSMYFGGGTPSFDNGLFSAVAVNTDILTRAGLQTGDQCSYDRSMKYTLGKNTPIVTTAPRNVWDNDLYKSYFDNSFESDTWDIYTSVLYNLSKSLYNKEINISPSLEFTYEDGATKLIEGDTVKYSHQNVALELLDRLEAGKEGYIWENYEAELAEYAGR
ncbi:hypothetical protein NDGK_01847 [Clostridiales bacterium CHKCI001]|nr:hypothetical protein NDGK_01847 [Clostridiales bacterium CHKCI001]